MRQPRLLRKVAKLSRFWRMLLRFSVGPKVPSDTKLSLTKIYSEIIIFGKITNLTRNSLRMSFLDISRAQNLSKITKNNSQGIIFVIISCQSVRLQGYGYNLFCSHSSCCLAVLVWQCFEEAFCAPKVQLKWYGFKGFPSHSSHCSGGLFPQCSGVSPDLGARPWGHSVLRRVLRRFWEGFWRRILRRVLRRGPAIWVLQFWEGFWEGFSERVLRRGSPEGA